MTATLRPSRSPRAVAAARPRAIVDVLVCGSSDRGDDGAPTAAARLFDATLPDDVRVRLIGQLDVDHLLSIPEGAGVVIVDAATGVASGSIHELPLHGGLSPSVAIRPRSSHALEVPEVIGVADMIRGRPITGSIIVIGGRRFGLGRPLSASVAKALPGLARAVLAATDRIRAALIPEDAAAPLGRGA
jgi:hydrogenase maturation protease